MKISRYNIESKSKQNGVILHNMISKNTVVLDLNEYKEFKGFKCSKENAEMLFQLGFYISKNKDELEDVLSLQRKDAHDKTYLNITLIPTFACNLGCIYCYQNGIENKTMSLENQEVFINFVIKRLKSKKSKSFHLSWYGGEPLVAFSVIKRINTSLKDFCKENKIKFSSSIATNLTLLTEEMRKKLKELNVVRIETTLAGEEREHNLLRPCNKSDENSFLKTIDGIKKLSERMTVMININFCKQNFLSIKKLFGFLRTINNRNIYLNFNEIINYDQNKQTVEQFKNYDKKRYELFIEAMENNLQICDTSNFCGNFIFCPQYHINSFAIDGLLNVYKCTDRYEEETKFGIIDKITFDIKETNSKQEENIPNKKCKKCKFLPYCNGGCHIKRQRKEKPCPTEIDSVYKYLELFVKREELKSR